MPHGRFRQLRVMYHPVFVVHNFMSVNRSWPNKSPEPTAVGAGHFIFESLHWRLGSGRPFRHHLAVGISCVVVVLPDCSDHCTEPRASV